VPVILIYFLFILLYIHMCYPEGQHQCFLLRITLCSDIETVTLLYIELAAFHMEFHVYMILQVLS
jgi:hypothetical protein